MSSDISTIIVNYNAGAFIADCIDSLLKSRLEVEIIVVDNASTDGSLDALQGLPNVRLISNTENIGFSAACNIGVRAATSEFLLFLNPDCSFIRGTLVDLLDALKEDDHVGMVGGRLTNYDGSEQAGGRRAIPTPWRSFVKAFGLNRFSERWPRLFKDFNLHRQPLPEYPIEVEAISGACMLVKRQALEDVGLWDEGYFLHCEDLDLCMRFRKKGWEILFVPGAPIVHLVGSCSGSRPVFVEWHKHKGMMRFYLKFFRHQYPGVLMWLVALGVWLRFAGIAVFYSMRRFLRWFRLGESHG
ncbi:MAG: glycosyltransferase family 2 protein [Gammaproteobacteria bacterium]|nr:glycosyltransferase family 2 protein [Gammaproteobacteria bacterium]